MKIHLKQILEERLNFSDENDKFNDKKTTQMLKQDRPANFGMMVGSVAGGSFGDDISDLDDDISDLKGSVIGSGAGALIGGTLTGLAGNALQKRNLNNYRENLYNENKKNSEKENQILRRRLNKFIKVQ